MSNAFSPYGDDLFGDPIEHRDGTLATNYLFPPFSVLDARSGPWQQRKRAWLAYGIESEVGRDVKVYDLPAWMAVKGPPGTASGISVFDPVLTEVCYRWFCPRGGSVLDPFAGGSVRGIVAGLLGRHYTGIELRAEQVAANEAQADLIAPPVRPQWITGDAAAVLAHPATPTYDMVLTCPPFYDLEVYSDDPADISAMGYPEFRAALGGIVEAACARLRPDRFAVIVMADIRDKRTGHLRNLVAHTTEACLAAGLSYYNEIILLTMVGSLATRSGRYFNAGRKVGKSHQQVLVFVKGDWREAAAACAQVDWSDGPNPPVVPDPARPELFSVVPNE